MRIMSIPVSVTEYRSNGEGKKKSKIQKIKDKTELRALELENLKEFTCRSQRPEVREDH